MALRDVFETARRLLAERSRRAWIGTDRAHIELRDVDAEELEILTRRLNEAKAELGGVRSIEVNPHTRRIVVCFDPGTCELERLIAMVEEAERAAAIDAARFVDELREHPADVEPEQRLMLELGADVAGFLVGLGLSVSPFQASRVAAGAASLLTIVAGSPRLRQGIDERLGPHRAELVMDLAVGLAQGFAQRPVSSLVEIAHKTSKLREARARRTLWHEREAELCARPSSHAPSDVRAEPRPRPLPRGPIEEYTDRAWIVALAGFGVSFLTTRNFQRAVGALFGGLPKPARFGRDVFAAELGRILAARGALVFDNEVLRRLDRVDCVVLQGDLVARDRIEIADVVCNGAVDPIEARRRASRLFDPQHLVEVRYEGEWAVGPPRMLSARLEGTLAEQAEQLSSRGALVLGLRRGEDVVALIEVQIVPQTGIDELIATAHAAQMRVVISSSDEAVLQGVPADDTIGEGEGLRAGIRRLQREGRGVLLVAAGGGRGLATADVTVGLARNGEAVPWGSHIIVRDDLADVRFLLHACVSAREIAKQSVNIALGAATAGALVSAGGVVPMTTRRVLAVVNGATLISMGNAVRVSTSLARRALPPPRDRTPWHALDSRGVLTRLGTSDRGLSRADAAERHKPELHEKAALAELAEAVTDELFSPLAPLLAAGAGLSAVVGSVADAAMVGGVLGLNALVGGVQRFRTERAIRELSRTTRRRALVRREGQLREVDAGFLVRGDVVVLGPGDVVPADCRILEGESLEVDASSLTGESLPVKKTASASFDAQIADRSSMLYEGTSIASGRATGIVVAVGDQTEARRGAAAASRSPIRSGVEQRLRSLIDLTGPVALGAGVGLVGAGLLRGRKLEDLVGSGVSLAVASVPEGLPVLATAAQLAAAERLSRRGALVRNARSIEALGRVDVLCVDKTGTVTEGRIQLSSVSDGEQEEAVASLSGARVGVVGAALRAAPDANHRLAHADPTDAALLRAADALGVAPDYGCEGWHRGAELAFEAGRGYHAVLGRAGDGSLLSVKGAPEAILPQCTRWRRGHDRIPLDADARRRLEESVARLALRGLRVLAVAERYVGAEDRLEPGRLVGLTFHGLLAFSDPVRPSAAAAIVRLRRAGVDVVMITGDHPSTAQAIASELDLLRGRNVLSGAELAKLSDTELDARINRVSVFARVTPPQKVRVVRALQRAGRVVAMLGDGANDAPAIRLANVGIAIGERSSAAARTAADVVVSDDRIETVVDAIVEGRAMWASVRDAVSILVGGNLGEIGFTLAAGMLDGRPPLNARQLLLVNVLTDVAPAMAIAVRPPAHATLESLAEEGPEASLGQPLTRDIVSRAAITALGAGSAWIFARAIGSRESAGTVSLLALVGTQLGQTMISGGPTRPVLTTSLASAAALAAVVQTPGLSHFFGCRPLGPVGWATAIGASALATGAAVYFPNLADSVAQRLQLHEVMTFEDPNALPEGPTREESPATDAADEA